MNCYNQVQLNFCAVTKLEINDDFFLFGRVEGIALRIREGDPFLMVLKRM